MVNKEKTVCPYCEVDLHKFDKETDRVARCGHCGEITCHVCIPRHFFKEHPGYIQYGRLDEHGQFHSITT